ncbi:hypothetical protein [Streptomyces sp. NBC_00989]|uniref:hypothetical protein n=1 Tax=Streptomyces sp. NBC_00989 TaxID=2903705 RepID=UPI0038664137|nr:hypothetical protein OG714_47395 [Streptomyces sp. NBC_00989]
MNTEEAPDGLALPPGETAAEALGPVVIGEASAPGCRAGAEHPTSSIPAPSGIAHLPCIAWALPATQPP